MTPSNIFERPKLVQHHKSEVEEWAKQILDLLRTRQTTPDRMWLVEDIVSISRKADIHLKQGCYHSGGHTSEDIARSVRFDLLTQERNLFTFEPDGSGLTSAIEKMEGLLESLSTSAPHEHRLALTASHAIAIRRMRRNGVHPYAFDPITLRLLDRISSDEMEEFLQRHADIALWLTNPEEGRGLENAKNPQFLKKLNERLPELSEEFEGKRHQAPAFGFFTFQRRLDVIQVKTPKHKNGSLRGSTLFIEQDLPSAMRIAAEGRLLDDVVRTPATEGLGLVVTGIEDASPGIAIHTDADTRLTVVEMKVG